MIRHCALLLLLVPLGACRRPARTPEGGAPAPAPSSPEPRRGGVLRVHMEAEPPTLNPLVEHDAWTTWLGLGALYDPLVRQDPRTGAFSPGLARAWEEPDARTLRLRLREGVRWHDGRPFGSEDVRATLARLREPGAAPDARADFADLAVVEVVDGQTVALRFTRPAPLALQALAHLAILPAHHLGPGDLRAQPASRAPVGTGPFRFVSWQAGDRIVLARNPDYFGGPPYLDGVELRIVRDREAAWELLCRGDLDLLWQLTPAQADRVPGSAARPATAGLLGATPPPPGARRVTWHLPRYSFVVWNTERPGLADVRVRQALGLLVDHRRYGEQVFRGRALPVTGPFPPDSPSYDAAIQPWPFDPARARSLLDAAGVRDRDGDGVRELPSGEPFRLAFLLTAGSPTLEPLATMMQEDLGRAGVGLTIVPAEWAALLDRLRRHAFDATALMWVMQPVQDNYTLFHASQVEGGQNYGAFRDRETDQLLEAARALPPGPARAERDRALHHRLHQQQPYAFLVSPPVDSLVAARVHGYAPSAAGLGLAAIWVE